MVFAARLSEATGPGADGPGRPARAAAVLARARAGRAAPPTEDVLAAMRMDKKYRGGVRFVLLEDVGRPFVEDDVPEDVVRATLEAMAPMGEAEG